MPCAGILCDIVAAFQEYLWAATYDMLRTRDHLTGANASIFVMRYVDNRLNLIDHMLNLHPAAIRLQSLHFYRPPVILEPVTDDKLLGFTLTIDNQQQQLDLDQRNQRARSLDDLIGKQKMTNVKEK